MSWRTTGGEAGNGGLKRGDRWNLTAVVCAAACAAVISLAPLVSESSETSDSTGAVVVESTTGSLLESEGKGIVAVALIPALIAAFPMLGRTRQFRQRARVGASVVLGVCAVLGAASVGVFVVPTLLLMIVAASRPDASHPVVSEPAHRS